MSLLPTCATFFLPSSPRAPTVQITHSVTKPLTALSAEPILKYLSLAKREHLVLHSESNQLQRIHTATPFNWRCCSIGDNTIELDVFTASWTFTSDNTVIRNSNGFRKEVPLRAPQDNVMKRILKYYIGRRGTRIQKLYLKSYKAVQLLREVGIIEKFDIVDKDGVSLRDNVDLVQLLPGEIASKIEWRMI
ncbi:CRE-SDZ-32 protein [Caenorhabditis remanei]|uniref:CRE-SDZ-32 protein n=1 Tax=Caenorhabditis remanei TaxID=31234 RepID=E3MXF8_CAERE|nr:CRE-SDZ-32 protein [Caenorhabditis remanei]